MCTQVITMNFRIPRVWELLNRFKSRCQLKGWETSEEEDWVKTGDNKYHNLLWTQTIHPSTFRKIAANQKCAIRKGVSYQIVDVSYTAWLFSQSPPENLMEIVKGNIGLSRRIAIYDLSRVYGGKSLCFKLNETDSTVFKEFERFLEEELEVTVEHSFPRMMKSSNNSKFYRKKYAMDGKSNGK